ncbi:MAG: LysR family transcriptional regulator, partial [Pseudomonadota bacterium]
RSSAWRNRPLRLAFENNCLFRASTQRALDDAGIPWDMAVESDSSKTIEASVSADIAVHVALEGTAPPMVEAIRHGGELPELKVYRVNLYRSARRDPAVSMLDAMLRQAYADI